MESLYSRDIGPSSSTEVLVHVHGFAISGTYLLPTAERLSDRFRSVVPDLPGFGRTPRSGEPLDFSAMADCLARHLDELGIERATLVGNSMGCPVICEFDHLHHDRLERAVLVSPAGGLHSRPFARAVGQLAQDSLREDLSMARIAVPDYLRFGPVQTLKLFRAMTEYPTIERFLELSVPALAVLGSRDPLLPGPARVTELVRETHADLEVGVVMGAAHAINYSHPADLAWMIRSWIDHGAGWAAGAPAGVRRLAGIPTR
jgi:pimeloyl-ACP methyl ester carboxylesterase